MRRKLLAHLFQLIALQLKSMGEDVRLAYDNPSGTLSFQGMIKYNKKITIQKEKHEIN